VNRHGAWLLGTPGRAMSNGGTTVRGPMGEQRIMPYLPAGSMVTFSLHQPAATHFVAIDCQAAGCGAWKHGWTSTVDTSTTLGQQQARYIQDHSGRSYTRVEALPLVMFKFPPGQQCFQGHRRPLERDPIAVVRSGDWRGDPRRDIRRRHTKLEDWVDQFATHQDKLATRMAQG
jgi:hypothetical protein